MAADDEGAAKQLLKAKASKYDFVKVRVWIGEHYHVLSRFLLSRMLSATRVSEQDAVRVALQLKKELVDSQTLDVSQSQLEERLFAVMRTLRYGEQHVRLYRMITDFHAERVSLFILIGGTSAVGKSDVATLLGRRLNLPRFLQTHSAARLCGRAPAPAPLPAEDDDFAPALSRFADDCVAVRGALQGEVSKCLRDSKSLIVEGVHVDLRLYADLVQSSPRLIVVPVMLHASARTLTLHLHNRLAAAAAEGAPQARALVPWLLALQTRLLEHGVAETLSIGVDDHSPDEVADRIHEAVLGRMSEGLERLGAARAVPAAVAPVATGAAAS